MAYYPCEECHFYENGKCWNDESENYKSVMRDDETCDGWSRK